MAKHLIELFHLYRPSIVRITTRNEQGDLGTGTGFHIGDGWIVTARHVVENRPVDEIAGHWSAPKKIVVTDILLPDNPKVDVAVLYTNFELRHWMEKHDLRYLDGSPAPKTDHIPIGTAFDDIAGDDLLLTKVLLMGFPPIPMSSAPELVVVEGEVNAMVGKYTGPNHVHFVISSVPRGGFSGGPMISQHDFLLGIVTESLVEGSKPLETGFTAGISVDPLVELLGTNRVFPSGPNGNLIRDLYGEHGTTSPAPDAGGDEPHA